MEQQLTTTPHPHDPHRDNIGYEQVQDLIRYFVDPNGTKNIQQHWTGGSLSLFHDGIFMKDLEGCNVFMCTPESALRRIGAWPGRLMAPPPPQYVAVRNSVMRAAEPVCVAASNNKAQLIAHALNWYKPGRRYSTNPN